MKALIGYRDKDKAMVYKNRQRKINYAKGDFRKEHHKNYDKQEEMLILEFKGTDRELAEKLDRSVKSIHIKRWKIKNNYVYPAQRV